MFAARGYNIDSLSVAPTHDATVSRLTLVTNGSDAVVHQIVQQTRKLIDIVEIEDLSAKDHLECELAMIKVRVAQGGAAAVVECARKHRALLLDESEFTRTVRMVGTGAEVDAFVADISELSEVLELVRSGVAALGRGEEIMVMPS